MAAVAAIKKMYRPQKRMQSTFGTCPLGRWFLTTRQDMAQFETSAQ